MNGLDIASPTVMDWLQTWKRNSWNSYCLDT